MTRPSYSAKTYTLEPGEAVELHRYADFVVCLEARAPFAIAFDGGPETEFEKGLTFEAVTAFARVRIVNTDAATQTIRLGLGSGGIRDSRLALSSAISTVPAGADTFVAGAPVIVPDGDAVQVLGADQGRREAVLVNDGDGRVYIGGAAGAEAGEGLPLEPGQAMTLTTAAKIFARNDSGAAVPVAWAAFGDV